MNVNIPEHIKVLQLLIDMNRREIEGVNALIEKIDAERRRAWPKQPWLQTEAEAEISRQTDSVWVECEMSLKAFRIELGFKAEQHAKELERWAYPPQ